MSSDFDTEALSFFCRKSIFLMKLYFKVCHQFSINYNTYYNKEVFFNDTFHTNILNYSFKTHTCSQLLTMLSLDQTSSGY